MTLYRRRRVAVIQPDTATRIFDALVERRQQVLIGVVTGIVLFGLLHHTFVFQANNGLASWRQSALSLAGFSAGMEEYDLDFGAEHVRPKGPKSRQKQWLTDIDNVMVSDHDGQTDGRWDTSQRGAMPADGAWASGERPIDNRPVVVRPSELELEEKELAAAELQAAEGGADDEDEQEGDERDDEQSDRESDGSGKGSASSRTQHGKGKQRRGKKAGKKDKELSEEEQQLADAEAELAQEEAELAAEDGAEEEEQGGEEEEYYEGDADEAGGDPGDDGETDTEYYEEEGEPAEEDGIGGRQNTKKPEEDTGANEEDEQPSARRGRNLLKVKSKKRKAKAAASDAEDEAPVGKGSKTKSAAKKKSKASTAAAEDADDGGSTGKAGRKSSKSSKSSSSSKKAKAKGDESDMEHSGKRNSGLKKRKSTAGADVNDDDGANLSNKKSKKGTKSGATSKKGRRSGPESDDEDGGTDGSTSKKRTGAKTGAAKGAKEAEGEAFTSKSGKKGTSTLKRGKGNKLGKKGGRSSEDEDEGSDEDKGPIELRPLPPTKVVVKMDHRGVPKDFDWRHYLRLYPDLANSGVDDENVAKGHFTNSGFKEGRLQHLPPVYVEYTACLNVWEQLYSHIFALAMAYELRGHVVLPPALAKNRQGKWVTYPTDTILDVGELIQETEKDHQVVVWRTPKAALKKNPRMPDFNSATFNADTAYPWWRLDARIPETDVLTFGNFYHANRNMTDIVDEVVQRIGSKAAIEWAKKKRNVKEHRFLIVRIPCTAFAINDTLSLPTIQHAAKQFKLPELLKAYADTAVSKLRDMAGSSAHNGIVIMNHDDYLTFTTKKFPTVWTKFEKAITANIDVSLPCYLGMEELVDVSRKGIQKELKSRFVTGKNAGCKGGLYTRFDLVASSKLEDLHSEQHKLLDFLILLQSTKIVVNHKAVLGVLLDEWANLQGIEPPPEVIRVQTKLASKKKPLKDPWVPAAYLTTRHAHEDAAPQGLYDFLPQVQENQEEEASEGASTGDAEDGGADGGESREGADKEDQDSEDDAGGHPALKETLSKHKEATEKVDRFMRHWGGDDDEENDSADTKTSGSKTSKSAAQAGKGALAKQKADDADTADGTSEEENAQEESGTSWSRGRPQRNTPADAQNEEEDGGQMDGQMDGNDKTKADFDPFDDPSDDVSSNAKGAKQQPKGAVDSDDGEGLRSEARRLW